MFPLSLTSLQLETLDIMHFHCDFQNSDSLICLINHYSDLELHQSIRTTSCIYPAHGGLVCLQLSTKNAEECGRAAPLESNFLGVPPASHGTLPKHHLNWPVACVVCLRDDAIVLHADCIFAQQQRENRIHQDDRCECGIARPTPSAVKSAIISIFTMHNNGPNDWEVAWSDNPAEDCSLTLKFPKVLLFAVKKAHDTICQVPLSLIMSLMSDISWNFMQ